MNTKWEEEFKERFDGLTEDENHDIKAFIKDQITKAQQEIAEQIIEDIPEYLVGTKTSEVPLAPTYAPTDHLKNQLRDKYIN